jgi:alcohol oxidase
MVLIANQFYKSQKSKHLNNREAIVPMGGILGGGSSINFMMYTRAQGADFDAWKTPGWTAKEMLPLLNKLEMYYPKREGIDERKHGYEGPVNVGDGGYRGKSEEVFMDTVTKMGYKDIKDLQDLDGIGGFSVSDNILIFMRGKRG